MTARDAGKHSEALKLARRLVRERSERLALGLCVIEGRRIAADYLEEGGAIRSAFVAASAWESCTLLGELEARAVELLRVEDSAFSSIASTTSPQGILLLVPRPDTSVLPLAFNRPALVGWGLQDPSNVGALVRAAAASGCCAAIFGREPGQALADPFSPAAVRASAGACFRLELVERELSPADFAAELERSGYRPIALTPRDGCCPEDMDLRGAAAFLVGSETRGLPSVLEAAGERLSLPLDSGVESLGAAAAGAVVLFEAARQRRAGAPPSKPQEA